jgi:Holliday junction DNA helicase RuvA
VITRIRGELAEITDRHALLHVDALTYAVLVPAADVPTLLGKIGQSIEFYTLHYFEGLSQGNTITPQLIGFSNKRDRAFFELFTTVKGIGNRKALRALIRPFMETAAAIANRDSDALTSLPEIGTRSAETIIAQLHGKVDQFLGDFTSTIELSLPPCCQDAIAMLMQLGESQGDAKRLVQRAYESDPNIESADQLVQTSFQLRGSPQ